MEDWVERKKRRYKEELEYIRIFFPSVVEGTIIKIDASEDGGFEYEEKTGVNFLEEKTLILGDSDNNAFLVFKKEKGVATKDITNSVHVIDKYDFDPESIIHKKREPSEIPKHLKIYITIVNVMNNNNNLNVTKNSRKNDTFLERNYRRGGMCSLKQIKRHPEWREEYRNEIKTKRVHICKSCGKEWMKKCCKEYSQENRVMWMMVIGWHEESRPKIS